MSWWLVIAFHHHHHHHDLKSDESEGWNLTMYDDEAQNYNNLCICVVQYDGKAQY